VAIVDLSTANTYPHVKRITLGLIDVVQAITIPADCTRFSLQFIANGGKYSHTGADGVAIGAEYSTIAADSIKVYDRGLRAGNQTIYVAGSAAAVVVEIELERVS
jgi:hypothetical protein